MSVEASLVRKAVEVTWDTSLVNGSKVTIKCVNPDGGDVSTRDNVKNDGKATVTFPADYSGETHVTVSGSGHSEDSGTISV